MPIELAWTIERDDDFDAYEFARRSLDSAIECLKEDGELQGAAFVLTPFHLHCLAVSFQGQAEKEETYGEVISFARQNQASMIIALNDAWWGPIEAAENYYPGKLREEYGWECIQVAVSGPGIRNWVIKVRYRKKDGKFLFHMPEEESGGAIRLASRLGRRFEITELI